jgi:hypothetical protein
LKIEERRRRRRRRRRQYKCTRRLYIYYRESKNLFRLEGSNSVSPLFLLVSAENW